jgi:hypothetical protein
VPFLSIFQVFGGTSTEIALIKGETRILAYHNRLEIKMGLLNI